MSKTRDDLEQAQTIIETANSAAEAAARKQPKKKLLDRNAYTAKQQARDAANFSKQHGKGKGA